MKEILKAKTQGSGEMIDSQSSPSSTHFDSGTIDDGLLARLKDIPFVPPWDNEAIEKEWEKMDLAVDKMESAPTDPLSESLSPISQYRIYTYEQERERFRSESQLDQLSETAGSFQDVLNKIDFDDGSELGIDPKDWGIATSDWGNNFIYVFWIGAEIGLYTASCDIRRIITQSAKMLVEKASDFNKLTEFDLARDLLVKFHGINLLHLSRGSNIPLSARFGFFLESWDFLTEPILNGSGKFNFDPVLQVNQEELDKEYPNCVLKSIVKAALTAQALIDIEPRAMDRYARENTVVGKSANLAKELLGYTNETREDIYKVLFKSKAPKELPALIKQVGEYLTKDSSRIRVLRVANILRDLSHITFAYREAVKRSNDEGYGSTYCNIASAIKAYIKTEPESINLPPLGEDVGIIFNKETSRESGFPDWKTLKNIAVAVRQIAPKTMEFKLDPRMIPATSFGRLITPEKAEVLFDVSNPTRFIIKLSWQNDESEDPILVHVQIDTKNEKFDWSILESPEENELKDLQEEFMFVAKGLLSICQEQAIKAKKEIPIPKVQSVPDFVPVSVPSNKKESEEHHQDEVYGLKKIVREEARNRQLELSRLPQSPDLASVISIKHKNQLVVDPNESLESKLENLDLTESRQVVRDAINQYNEYGLGRFKKLSNIPPDGKPRWVLKVTSPEGAIRVICLKIESGEVGDRFQIDKVYKRANAYKKLYR